MNLHLERLTPDDWSKLSKDAHKIVFCDEREPEMDRIDYALLVTDGETPCCFSTQIELDEKSVYMQHGGAFPSVANGIYTVKGYFMLINELKKKYSVISTRTWNLNIKMIKLALAAGLLINGVEFIDGEIFLNLMWRKDNERINT